ncbi:hypothetical protein BK278_21330 [Escherichia coli]|nr:hypothetical protein [Escherichia coli]OJM29154.1 hypothetical protein BK278_21330 [Escherichia coli]OJM80683.1 hypothetical protein BK287_02070 [Escherichia coli]HAJ6565390.1 hypothetical protein [Escherichia coli]HAJ6911192.1 hypothetical protein [Escherichia coli]
MIKLSEKGVFLASNNEIIAEEHFTGEIKKEEAKKGTIAWSILSSHNTSGNMDKLKIKFDPYNAPTYQPLGRWDGIFHYIPPSF